MQFITTFVTNFVPKFITKFGDSLSLSPHLVTNLVTNSSLKTLGVLPRWLSSLLAPRAPTSSSSGCADLPKPEASAVAVWVFEHLCPQLQGQDLHAVSDGGGGEVQMGTLLLLACGGAPLAFIFMKIVFPWQKAQMRLVLFRTCCS